MSICKMTAFYYNIHDNNMNVNTVLTCAKNIFFIFYLSVYLSLCPGILGYFYFRKIIRNPHYIKQSRQRTCTRTNCGHKLVFDFNNDIRQYVPCCVIDNEALQNNCNFICHIQLFFY